METPNYMPQDAIRLKMPDGIKEILEVLYREILREQPDDIIPCACRILDNMIEQKKLDGTAGD